MEHLTAKKLIAIFALALSAVSGCAVSPNIRSTDTIPMYGQPALPRSAFHKKADQDFIEQASKGLGNRQTASKAWFAEAEKAMAARDIDLAMRRYNQAWLLNPENYQPYWGFGRVELERGNIDEAIHFLNTAVKLSDELFQKVALLADLGSAYSTKAMVTPNELSGEKTHFIGLANQRFSESTAIDPTYGNGWRRWALSLYEQSDFADAWAKVKQARAANAPPFPPAFIRALESKLPEPVGR